MDHAGEFIELTETNEASHRNYLAEWTEKVWPIFQHYGFSRDAALMYWELNKIGNKMDELREAVDDRF